MALQNMYEEFVALLGAANITSDQESISSAETTNYKTDETISSIIRPASVLELQQCIEIAKKYKQPVYTVSKGMNWGYGSRVPVTNQNILIELGRMNTISDFDEKLGYITVEPGVTFNQAFNFLREKSSELLISTTGGSGDASMIGNALERGIGTGLYADRFNFVCGLEVLLPNGEIINTGFDKPGDFKTGKVFRWGEGPFMDGIFSQSNFGIVTKMTIWLTRVPNYLSLVFYKINGSENLKRAVDILQDMTMDGLVRPTITIYNDLRVMSSLIQFPFQLAQPGSVDPDLLLKQIRAASPIGGMVGDWNGEISIRSASKEHADLQYSLIVDRLREVVEDITVVLVPKEEALETYQQHYTAKDKNLSQPTLKSFLVKKYLGIPDNSALRQSYWRKRTAIPADLNPDRDHCGMIWICPVVPFDGEDVLKAVDIIKAVIKKHHFEPSVSLQCITERCINIIASISWDRDVAGEDEMGESCYLEAVEKLQLQGYFIYRSTTLKMHQEKKESSYTKFIASLKKAIDPEQLLSPGRYIRG